MSQGKKELWIQTALPLSLLSKSILMVVFGSSYHDSDRNFSHPKSCGWFTTCFFHFPPFPLSHSLFLTLPSLSLLFLFLSYFLKVSVLPHFHHPKTREWRSNGREIVSSRERKRKRGEREGREYSEDEIRIQIPEEGKKVSEENKSYSRYPWYSLH